jgi:cellulose synthase/poly-beta-1,6-N-acetylglucosamine synthase-like glycosyltransferase
MLELEIIFWVSFAVLGYTSIGYPLLLAVAGRLWCRRRRLAAVRTSVSIVVAVHNEAKHLDRRLDELTMLLRSAELPGEVIVVSDGSTDGSVDVAQQYADRGVRVIALAHNAGKAAALSHAIAEAQGEIVVFADARQRWADDALVRLLENFADPQVGAVSGDLVLESAPGVMAGVGIYWRYEKWLRRAESRVGSQVGVSGAICAVRRDLLPPSIPPGTLLDDIYWPMWVAMRGYSVVHDERALAYDRLPEQPRDEFRRKVRTLTGNYQLMTLLPASLVPWRNPVWLPWVSRKLLRLVMPWTLLGMFSASAALVDGGSYATLFAAQVACYLLAALGLMPAIGQRSRLLATAASFLVLNTAAWLAFWVWITGQAGNSWHRVAYDEPVEPDTRTPRPRRVPQPQAKALSATGTATPDDWTDG